MKIAVNLVIAITAFLLLSVVLVNCKKDDPKPLPTIVSFTPVSALAGSVVNITGTNFSTIAANNVVKFNSLEAFVTSATTTQIITVVPALATTGKITVTINGVTVTSATDFVVTPPSLIISFTPISGYTDTQVVIIGTKFKEGIGSNMVKFNGKDALVLDATTTQIITRLPAGTSTGKITVTTNGVTSTSQTDFIVLILHTITSFTPTSGSAGTSVTIAGTTFSTTLTDNTVLFNGKEATVTAATPTSLTVVVPSGATTGRISVTINQMDAVSSTDFIVN